MPSLRQLTEAAGLGGRALHDETGSFPLQGIAGHGFLADHRVLQGAAVLLRTRSQRAAALALLDLDGLAARIVLCTPDLSASQIEAAVRIAGVSAIVTDDADDPALAPLGLALHVLAPEPSPAGPAGPQIETGWALFTSGTSGTPKLAEHTLATLTAAIDQSQPKRPDRVWATFYDIRRYGGLQILLRALLGGGSMVLSGADEPTAFLERAAAAGVSFLSGTPTHWRRALLSSAAQAVALTDVRLSGEAADQSILDKLRAVYPAAQICHAFASTEAGVAFEVRDGLAGFPADWLDRDGVVALRLAEGTLRIRSPGQAMHYLGDAGAIAGADGFVDTRDLVVARGARLHFAGRSDGVINVGGLKVNPIEVEEVVNQHPRVAQARVGARRSPIIGQVIVAEVVPADPDAGTAGLEADILAFCRNSLASHKVPAMVRFVAAIEMNAAGKVVRTAA
jgi:acyl-coenzyme A synthetase/AMP-(fatty) acid ligase